MALRDILASICISLPGTVQSDPWGGGHDAWKVGDKMFTCIGSKTPGVAVKCPDIETAEMLIEAGVGTKAPYFHKSWLLLPANVDEAVLRHRVLTSYDIVRSGLTKKLQATLPPRDNA